MVGKTVQCKSLGTTQLPYLWLNIGQVCSRDLAYSLDSMLMGAHNASWCKVRSNCHAVLCIEVDAAFVTRLGLIVLSGFVVASTWGKKDGADKCDMEFGVGQTRPSPLRVSVQSGR